MAIPKPSTPLQGDRQMGKGSLKTSDSKNAGTWRMAVSSSLCTCYFSPSKSHFQLLQSQESMTLHQCWDAHQKGAQKNMCDVETRWPVALLQKGGSSSLSGHEETSSSFILFPLSAEEWRAASWGQWPVRWHSEPLLSGQQSWRENAVAPQRSPLVLGAVGTARLAKIELSRMLFVLPRGQWNDQKVDDTSTEEKRDKILKKVNLGDLICFSDVSSSLK